MDEIQADRLAALRAGGADSVARLFARVPSLAEAVAGVGVLGRYTNYGYLRPHAERIPSIRALAVLLEREHITRLILAHVSNYESWLLTVARYHGGALTREVAHEAVGSHLNDSIVEGLDAAAAGLADLLLSNPQPGWVALRPGVIEHVRLPGALVRSAFNHIASEVIADTLRALHVSDFGTRKNERIAALETALRNPVVVNAALAEVSREAREVFFDLARSGPQPVREFGSTYFGRIAVYDTITPRTPLHALHERGLVGVDAYEQTAWVWLDCVVALSDGFGNDWSRPSPTVIPLSGELATMPRVVARLDSVLDRWRIEPPKALKSGGLGVAPIRASAKSLGVPPGEVGLLASLAIELGLFGMFPKPSTGTGRNRTFEFEWRATSHLPDWRARHPSQRWALLVQHWRDSTQLDTGGPIERYEPGQHVINRQVRRDLLLRTLLATPEETGYTPEDLTALLLERNFAMFGSNDVAPLIEELRVLGLVPATGVVGLTPAGRTLIERGAEAVADQFGGASSTFLVQGDHTVIAPPDLAAEIRSGLEDVADLESDAGAFIFRIADAAVTRALDHGKTVDDLVEFLHAYSSVPVPSNVERTVRDAAARHGRIVVGTTTSYIVSDDPVLLASAVAVKSAQLIAITPTTAVSPLPEAKVLAALRGKDLAPVSASGPAIPADDAEEMRNYRYDPPQPLRDQLLFDEQTMVAMAKHLADMIIPQKKSVPGRAKKDSSA